MTVLQKKKRDDNGFECQNEDCYAIFAVCPFCQEWLVYFAFAIGECEQGYCPNLVMDIDGVNGERWWHIKSEEKAFEAWCEERERKEEDFCPHDAFDEYAKDRGYVKVYVSDGVRHAAVSHTFYQLEHPPEEK
ncbi:MAG TPA: hypothetical protein PLY90_11545 [Candidatus Hydrogenedentes bacterium]|nr:MAG: hypothetical protein BWY07_02449 [Candidatus Hydrogenedentes bacterium ADurb.Bin170]HOD96406.1 hypothetical protein [Candidatus Hydrogenedentota bacterium]HOR51306.1 hypothetical protein [Candidatus Hydrogenedentota bacterium]HPK25864.1 hypothetical protein [Candidatus Hydrogenedentota bacterium]HPX87422.1 hypothetical protein [Candidatus Hydrogenedentota bacterium]